MIKVSSIMPLIAALLYGCSSNPEPTASASEKKMETQVTAMKSQLDELQKSVRRLEFELSSERNRFSSALLDTSSKGYSRVDTTSGTFLVALKDVKPYADGYRLALEIGNLSSATYSGFTINAKWGKSLDTTDYSEWQKSQREKTFPHIEKLLPGSWNTVYVVLAPAQKEDLGYMEVSLSTDNVFLTVH